jgi:hypothetical protein
VGQRRRAERAFERISVKRATAEEGER